LATLGVLAGLITYHFSGWQPLDPLVAIAFTAVGAFFALRQLRKVIHPLMDGALPTEQITIIEKTLDQHEQVRDYHNVRTRDSGPNRFVTLHVLLDDDLSFVAAHDLAEQIEDELGEALGGASVIVHYEPYEAEIKHRALEHD
jgi:ferrous-iron efflux pump FieF